MAQVNIFFSNFPATSMAKFHLWGLTTVCCLFCTNCSVQTVIGLSMLGIIMCTHMLMHAIACAGCFNTIRESALKVDWEKNPLTHWRAKPALVAQVTQHSRHWATSLAPHASESYSFTNTHPQSHKNSKFKPPCWLWCLPKCNDHDHHITSCC